MARSEYPKQVTLNDGQKIVIRPLEAGDEEALIRFFAELPAESTEFLKHDVRDPAVARRFVEERDSKSVFAVVALAPNGAIVGDATLHMNVHGWLRRVGEVRAVVAPSYQRQHLASTLLRELVNEAALRNLAKLEAQILGSQVGARMAFERLGFREEARLKAHALDLHDRPHDVIILTTSVDDIWRKMEDLISDWQLTRDVY